MWVVGTELRSYAKGIYALNPWGIAPFPEISVLKMNVNILLWKKWFPNTTFEINLKD